MALEFNWRAYIFRELMLRKEFGNQLTPNASNLNQLLSMEEEGLSLK